MPCPHLGAHRFHDGTGREEDLADLRQRDGAETAERRIGPLQIRHLGPLDDWQPRQLRLAPEVPRREPRALEPAADTRRALPGMRDQAGQPPALIAPPRGGRERLLGAVPVPATAVGRRNRLGSHYWPTMSGFMGARAPSSAVFAPAGTLFLSRAFTSASTVAFHSASVIFMPRWTVFMSCPFFLHGPPVASQFWLARFDLHL